MDARSANSVPSDRALCLLRHFGSRTAHPYPTQNPGTRRIAVAGILRRNDTGDTPVSFFMPQLLAYHVTDKMHRANVRAEKRDE